MAFILKNIFNTLQNEFLPPDWLPLLQVVIGRIDNKEEEISMLFQLLSSVVEAGEKDVAVHIPLVVSQLVDAIANYMPSNIEPWPQVSSGLLPRAIYYICLSIAA